MSADVLSCAVDVVHSKAMILANSVLSLFLIYNNVLLLLAAKLADAFVVVLFYFFILSLLSACWYFFALARFAFRVPRGAIFAGASRDQSLQSSPMPWWVLSVFLPYFFILSLFNACWYFFALARFVFRAPRGTIFAGASRDQSLQSSPMRRSIFVLSYFFILSLLSACWYFLALALCSLSVFAKLCVPEKSSFAHMYR